MSALSRPPMSISSLCAFAQEPPPLLPSPEPHTWAAPPPQATVGPQAPSVPGLATAHLREG